MRDITYPPIIVTAKLCFKALGLRFQMEGTENVPKTGGALLALNHVSYVDFILGGLAAHPSRRLVRFMAKRELFDHRLSGPLMRSLHHISVDRADGLASYAEAVQMLRDGEVVGIFPEATISRSFELKEFKTGATRMAAEAGVPLIPVVLWGTQRLKTKSHPQDFSRGKTIAITVGEPLHPTGGEPGRRDRRAQGRDDGAAGPHDPRLPRRGAAARLLVAPRCVRRQRADHGRGSGAGRRREARAGPRPGRQARRQEEVARPPQRWLRCPPLARSRTAQRLAETLSDLDRLDQPGTAPRHVIAALLLARRSAT